MKKMIFIGIILSLIAISFFPKFISFERTPSQKTWIVYKEQFIDTNRILDADNISSSEGQGFALFTQVTGDPLWAQVYQSGTSLMKSARFSDLNLPADWMTLSKDNASLQGANSTEFGENANRLPLYLMLAQDYQADLMAPFLDFWSQKTVPATVNLLTGETSEQSANGAMQAIKTVTEAKMKYEDTDVVSEVILPEVTVETDYNTATFILLSELPIVKK